MGQHTDIQWADSTVNFSTGCDGCELWKPGVGGPCYAGHFHEGRLAKSLPHLYDADFTKVRLAPGRTAKAAAWPDLTGKARPGKPWLDGLPRVVFPGDMSDMLSRAVSFEYLKAELIDVAVSPKGRRHVWMVLTKRPARFVEFGEWLKDECGVEWPANVWAGTSVTSEKTDGRAFSIGCHPAPIKFLSAEPMWGPVDFPVDLLREFSLVVVGGESRQRGQDCHPFNINWARAVRDRCREAGTSFFLKQLGSRPVVQQHVHGDSRGSTEVEWSYPRFKDSHGGDWSEWPEDLRVREFPEPAPTP